MTEEAFLAGIRKMQKEDREGLKEIYEAYFPYIFKIVNEILQNREDAEDVTQEFFIRLYRVASMYKEGSGHKGWMATIARNLALDHIRKYSREEAVEEMEDYATETINGPESEVVGDMVIEQALNLLQDVDRQIVAMKVLGDMKFREIADVLKMPLGTVTWRYQSAMKLLRRCGFE